MSKITFGIVNYNRLHYLKSCAESLMQSIQEQKDVQLICIDDNSKESGTKEYLQTLADRGWTVINQRIQGKIRSLQWFIIKIQLT